MAAEDATIAVLYEHPEWFDLLFAELDRRHLAYERIEAHRLVFDPEAPAPYALVVNRMSPSSWKRGHANSLFSTRDYLAHLEQRGIAVVNGSRAYSVEISKALQLDLFRAAGVAYPKARVINDPALAAVAARGLAFPVVVKPNIGGSGAGIVRFDSPDQLAGARVELGVDGTALVQEFLPARGGSIVRVEVLDGRFLYAIRIWPDLESFNLCPADICQTGDAETPQDFGVCPAETPQKKKLRIERADPPPEAIDGALRLAKLAALDVGGIEYFVDDRTGRVSFYDINALSNFVTDARNIVGFDPTARFVDYLERRVEQAEAARGVAASTI